MKPCFAHDTRTTTAVSHDNHENSTRDGTKLRVQTALLRRAVGNDRNLLTEGEVEEERQAARVDVREEPVRVVTRVL